ncbi:ATP12 family protein [Altererythrobacter sp. H2]|uniref:ATP12 family chaperone protein n=1 Tax=Altererythrobacter sp. H2 TaxID=3108391 RepID=UPI002B4C0753|nr:ATP12 family protein [Altererythrobacter sp. H2]WRK95521.1 ATP12 family protein [Altererythrobacter sp. H2]
MKRFYREVTVARADGGWRVLLDGRAIRTPQGAPQVVPTEALAQALAEEWRGQGDDIDPASLPFRDMADYAIDAVQPAALAQQLLRYAETDTLCYRADPDEPLYRRQQEVWEPLLKAVEARLDVRMERVSGVLHRPQPPETMAVFAARLAAMDPFTLAAVQAMASLAASLCVALSALDPEADVDTLWQAASLEELWQAELWGWDEQAEARRVRRGGDFSAAAAFARLARLRGA